MISYVPLSGKIPAGYLDRRIVIEQLVTMRENEEVVRGYVEFKSKRGHIEEVGGTETEIAGTETATGTVVLTIRYDSDLVIEAKKYEAFRWRYSKQEPAYLRGLNKEVIFDLKGNPLIQELQENIQYYNILRVNEFVGRRRIMQLISERVR